jgi:hypothetical protein
MIHRVVLRRFKRFQEETFNLPGHIVLAGPNNTGKSTVLQAIAAWGLAFDRWKQRNDFQTHNGQYSWQPIARQTFSAVPLRSYELLWTNRQYNGTIEIEVTADDWAVAMEFKADTTEQIYVRPKRECNADVMRTLNQKTVYVPPMTGLGTDEPVYQPAKIAQLLGQSRPGEVLRNLLVEASQSETAWVALKESIRTLFGYELLPPNADGPDIIAEYSHSPGAPRFDIASGGSGFQQVLMLATFLLTRPASVLLVDEPDAHLHVILQDVIYDELRSLSVKQGSQLVIATHSEVIIDSVDPRELCMMYGQPQMLADTEEKALLIKSLGTLTQNDIVLAQVAPGILYLEGHTDLEILREWARILGHPAQDTLTRHLFWKPAVHELRTNGTGIKARDHYATLQLVRDDLPGLILLDGDDQPSGPDTPVTGHGLQRLRWRRYEIESYLVHPSAMARYVEKMVGGPELAAPHLQDLQRHFEENYPPGFLTNPHADPPYLTGTKARTDLIPPALAAAGLHGIPYTRFHEIASVMLPAEIHPEVIEKLNAIQQAFNL